MWYSTFWLTCQCGAWPMTCTNVICSPVICRNLKFQHLILGTGMNFLIWHPQTFTSSPIWRRSSVILNLTVMKLLWLLWSISWRSRMCRKKKLCRRGLWCNINVLCFLQLTPSTIGHELVRHLSLIWMSVSLSWSHHLNLFHFRIKKKSEGKTTFFWIVFNVVTKRSSYSWAMINITCIYTLFLLGNSVPDDKRGTDSKVNLHTSKPCLFLLSINLISSSFPWDMGVFLCFYDSHVRCAASLDLHTGWTVVRGSWLKKLCGGWFHLSHQRSACFSGTVWKKVVQD